jgi:hypothetical protein
MASAGDLPQRSPQVYPRLKNGSVEAFIRVDSDLPAAGGL